MFDAIRKHQRLMQFLLLILIFPAFVFFGVSGYDRFLSDGDAVATVGGSQITRQEMDVAMRQQLEQLRRVLGERADARALDTPQARAEVLDGLVAQRVLLEAAAQSRVTVSDAQLRQTIQRIPGLQGADGSFDMARYKALLSGQGQSEAGFEYQLRRDLTVQTLPQAVAQSAFVPNVVLDRLIELQEQVREVRELSFKPSDFAASVQPGAAELAAYYERNAATYEIPESVTVQYVALSADSIAKSIRLDEADVRTYYEQNKARYGRPEERRASHILVRMDAAASESAKKAAREKADGLLARARAGEEFASLAKAHSEDPGSAASGGDVGFFAREAMVKPFADAAFALREGELSGVVESEFGLHLIRLTGVKSSAVKPFEEVRGEIEKGLRDQQATQRFAQAAEGFSNTVYEQSDSLKPAADKHGLEIRTAKLTRQGPDAGADPVLAAPALIEAVFSSDSLRNKRNTAAVEASGNTLVSARVLEHTPAKRRALDEVRAEVRARVIEEQARALAVKAGEARVAELRAGGAPTALAAPRVLSRAAPDATAPALLEAVFAAPAGKLPATVGVDLGAKGYVVAQIVRVTTPAAEAVVARRDAYRAQLVAALAQQQGNDLIEGLKARSKVVVHRDRLTSGAEPRR